MAEDISFNINANTQQAQQGLGNLTNQVDQFNLALGRVEKASLRIFTSLEQLSQRYQQQGFLGASDQRQLERSLQQWQRSTQILEAQRLGAQASLQQAMTAPINLAAANRAVEAEYRYTTRQQAMEVLAGRVGNVLGGQVPSTPLQAAQIAAGLPPTGVMSGGRFSRWGPPVAAPGWAGWTGMMPPPTGPGGGWGTWTGMMPPSPGPGWGAWTGMMPPSGPPGGGWGAWTGMMPPSPSPGWGAWTSMLPPTGPPGGGWDAWTSMMPHTRAPWWQRMAGYASQAGAAIAGGAGGGPMGMVGRGLARLPGIAVGYGAYQAISGGLAESEQRMRGVLEIGTVLQGQYENVDRTIIKLRDDYQILARDGRAALTTLARATGSVAGAPEAMRVGRAYGFEREAPAFLATLATLGGTGSLAEMTAVYNQQVAGRAPISNPRFMEAAIDMVGVGGFGARPLAEQQYAQITARMALMGGRYAQHPTEAYAAEFAGLQAPTSPLGESLRMTAVGALARRQRFIRVGDIENVDLSTWTGQRIAMEQAAQVPAMREAYYQRIAAHGRGNEGLEVGLFQEMFGETNTATALQRWRALEAEAGRPGGFYGPPVDATQEQFNIIRARTAQQADAEELRGQRLRERDAGMEALGETALIKGLQDVSTEIGKTVGATVKAWEATHDPIKTATAAIDELGKKVIGVASVMAAVTAALTGSPVLAGIALAGAGGVALEEVLRPFALPGSPTEYGIGAPSPRDPHRLGP